MNYEFLNSMWETAKVLEDDPRVLGELVLAREPPNVHGHGWEDAMLGVLIGWTPDMRPVVYALTPLGWDLWSFRKENV